MRRLLRILHPHEPLKIGVVETKSSVWKKNKQA